VRQIPASRLVTSYPIPPQESFTCPPYSVRVRRSAGKDVARYTYIATHDATSQRITVFRDIVHPDGKTTSTSTTQTLRTSRICYISCSSESSQPSVIGDIVAVGREGEVVCLTGENLAVQWSSSAKKAVQEVVSETLNGFEVNYVCSGTTEAFSEGIFKGRPEIFSALPKGKDSNPELIAIVARSTANGQNSRHLVMASVLSSGSSTQTDSQRLSLLDVVPLPSIAESSTTKSVYQIDIQSGLLLQLQEGVLSVYDITGAVPRLRSTVQMDRSDSFLRLSKPFVLCSSVGAIGLYNHQYRSVHAKAALDLSDLPADTQEPQSLQLVGYLRNQDLVVALVDSVLVSIQVEPPKSRGKRRKEGMLIDSIGRGTALEVSTKRLKSEPSQSQFSRRLPGTITETYLAKFHKDVADADEMLGNGKVASWEASLLDKFHMALKEQEGMVNGDKTSGHDLSDSEELPEWDWQSELSQYAPVDRRWVIYAISRIFSLELSDEDGERSRLRLILPESNVATYLAVAGHLTISNIKSAFREELGSVILSNHDLAEDMIRDLIDADGSMTLLLNYLQATKLGEVELLLAIRALMISMDLISDTEKPNMMKLLTNTPHEETDGQDMDIDVLEREVAIMEHYLGDGSSNRSRGLTLALAKLWRHPALSTVKALRTSLQTEEVVSLICLLRIELVRGAWTSLYIDPTSFDSDGQEPPPDGSIALISDLLGRCLDAVGAGGWLVNDAMSPADRSEAGDFLTALKLETTAALEGIEEAVYLNGIVGEAVRYGLAAQRSGATRQPWGSSQAVSMQLEGRESRLLPLGLKTKQMPSKEKVVAGGEVTERSARETGHLISQKVDAYSLEKLAV
jgi:hypothetical protein